MQRSLPGIKPLKLQVLVAALLSLHIGFASATVPSGMVVHGGAAPAAMASAAAPCHVHTDTTHGHCCASGACHCPGGCAMAAATQAAAYIIASYPDANPLTSHAALSPPAARELRPPILA